MAGFPERMMDHDKERTTGDITKLQKVKGRAASNGFDQIYFLPTI